MNNIGWLNIFSNKTDKLELRNSDNNNVNPLIKALSPVSENLKEEDILSIPTVQSIIEISGGTIAQLPIYIYQEHDDGSVERIYGDYREFLLNSEPNEFETSYNMKKRMVKDYWIYGVHRIKKEQSRNEVTALYSIPTADTEIEKYYDDGFTLKSYDIIVSGEGGSKTLKPEEVISILKDSPDGATAKGVLDYGKDIFHLMREEARYQSNVYKNGAVPLGILQSQSKINSDTFNRLKASWQNLYGGTSNAAKTVILEEGLEYKPVSLNPRDLLLNEAKKEHISEVCRLFNIPESLVNSQANKYGSLEQNNIAFLQYTLSPVITAIENALNKSLLLEDEKEKGFFFAFDVSEVLKTTEKEKYEAIKTSLDSGVITINEARAKVNMKPVKDDVMKWSLGAVLYNPTDGSMMVPNMGIGIPGYDKNKEVEKDNKNTTDSIEDNDKTSENNNNNKEVNENNKEINEKSEKGDK